MPRFSSAMLRAPHRCMVMRSSRARMSHVSLVGSCQSVQVRAPDRHVPGAQRQRRGGSRSRSAPPAGPPPWPVGVSLEEIARLVGHASTRTTEVVYRRELRPVISTGAEIMDELFAGG